MTDTYADLRIRIQNEGNNSAIFTDSNVNAAIKAAIAHYEQERWWFNEGRSNTFNTVANQEFYTSSDAAWIDDVAEISELTITYNGSRYQLNVRTWAEIDEWSVTTTSVGPPTDYCYFGAQFRLYPIPDAVYAIRFSGALALTVLSGDSDTNAWTQGAIGERLIRARAKWDVFANVSYDPNNSALCQQQMAEEYDSLVRANTKRTGTGRIRARF